MTHRKVGLPALLLPGNMTSRTSCHWALLTTRFLWSLCLAIHKEERLKTQAMSFPLAMSFHLSRTPAMQRPLRLTDGVDGMPRRTGRSHVPAAFDWFPAEKAASGAAKNIGHCQTFKNAVHLASRAVPSHRKVVDGCASAGVWLLLNSMTCCLHHWNIDSLEVFEALVYAFSTVFQLLVAPLLVGINDSCRTVSLNHHGILSVRYF